MPDSRFETCSKCPEPIWKPNRTHHCSVSKACIAKMDHYCPFVLTCIGAANHKAFFLFCFWQSLGIAFGLITGISWLYTSSIDFLSDNFSIPFRPVFAVIILGDFLVVVSFMFFAGGMAFTHWTYLQQNLTTLDDLGYNLKQSRADIGRVRSKYDFGQIYNLRRAGFLEWTWWLPIAHREKYEGYVWHELGKSREHFGFSGTRKMSVVKDGKIIEMNDADEAIEIAKEIYKGYVVMYFDDQVEI